MSFFLPAPSMIVVVLLLDTHTLGPAEHVQGHVLELDAEVLGDGLAGREDGDVLQHGLAAVAEARRFHGGHLQAAAELVDDERGQRLALDILGDDEERLAALHHRLEDRQERLKRRELLLVDEDVNVLELGDHLLGIGDEVGREIAAVELHALDHVEFGLRGFRLLDRDHALVADLLHRLGQHLADLGVAIRGDRADLGDLVVGGDFLGAGLEVRHDGLDGEINAAFEVHRVHAGGDGLRAFADDRMGEHGRGRGAVAGDRAGPGRDLAHHLGAHVLELVGELDLLRDGDAVLGDARRAEALLEHHVAALRAERHLHRMGQDVDTAQHPVARVG